MNKILKEEIVRNAIVMDLMDGFFNPISIPIIDQLSVLPIKSQRKMRIKFIKICMDTTNQRTEVIRLKTLNSNMEHM